MMLLAQLVSAQAMRSIQLSTMMVIGRSKMRPNILAIGTEATACALNLGQLAKQVGPA